jgi:capsule polysaccharide export protein KpsC/LpsZ
LKGSAADDATEFLAALAFVCHMHLKQRDFVWGADALQTKIRKIWQNTHCSLDIMNDSLLRSGKFAASTVGLLSKVGEEEYRFSHLTLQEYLAAKHTFQIYGNDAQQLMDQLKPLQSAVSKDSLCNREVSRFVSGMLKPDVFCKVLPAHSRK